MDGNPTAYVEIICNETKCVSEQLSSGLEVAIFPGSISM